MKTATAAPLALSTALAAVLAVTAFQPAHARSQNRVVRTNEVRQGPLAVSVRIGSSTTSIGRSRVIVFIASLKSFSRSEALMNLRDGGTDPCVGRRPARWGGGWLSAASVEEAQFVSESSRLEQARLDGGL